MESRWLRWIGTGVIAIVAVGSIVSTAVGAGQRPWPPGSCPDEPGSPTDAARAAAPLGLGDLRSQPWFRQDPHLDRSGALVGQRLGLGLDGARSSWLVDLPAESFAAGPFGGVVLVGSDDGARSQLEALDVAGECSWSIAQETVDVIRRATIDPTGTTVYEMRVDRATRADRGVWARPLDGSLPAVQVVEPIVPDQRFGRTWSTELTWELSGDRLAIQSCGEAACRTRVYDPSGGPLQVVSDPDLGTLVGLSGDALVTYAACPGLPCPVLAVDLDSAERRTLTDVAAVAVLAATVGGPRLVHEVLGESGVSVRAVSLDGSISIDLGPIPDDLRLHAAPNVGQTATVVPSGWVLIGPEGRLPAGGPDGRTELRHVPDGSAVQLDEVVR